MIRNDKAASRKTGSGGGNLIAVIDTETNWHNQVMSLGIAYADDKTFKCVDSSYYIFKEESRVGGMFSGVLYRCKERPKVFCRSEAMDAIKAELISTGVRKIFAYNAKFDYGHLPELADYEWYDIMRLAAYKQYNPAITDADDCCKTGRLRSNYGVEPITRMLSGDSGYFEIHNAVSDAVDELHIMELLGQELEVYACARL
ncbi:MAG: hypothetical protein K6F75_12040 [Butyrivibrio sp.]|nr:hypothetical protein [Butyrivibrio sp.]